MLFAVVLCASALASIDMQARLDSRWPVARTGETLMLTGRVSGLVAEDAFRSRFVLERDTPPYRTRLSWYDAERRLLPGDCVTASAKLDTPHGSVNPGSFDYEAWLWREGIDATGYIRTMGQCDLPAIMSIDRWRALALERLEGMLAGAPMQGIIAALSLGARDGITDPQWDVLRATGTNHLVAISGLHIGLIAGWLFFVTRWLALRLSCGISATRFAAVVAFAGALAYALLAGLALPTQRAVIMVAAGLFATVTMRQLALTRVLAIAAIGVVLWSPVSVIAPGFWLSFGAVAWLLYLGRFATQSRVKGFIVLQLALVAGLAPVTAWFFGSASLVAPLVNALLIPVAAFAVPVILAITMLALAWPTAGGPLLALLSDALNLAWPALVAVAEWPGAAVDIAIPGMFALALAVLGVAVLCMPRGLPGRWLAPVFLLPALFGWRPVGDVIAPGGYRLTMLDVGQGLAVVVRTRTHTLVYDAGPAYRSGFDAGEAFVVPYLRYVQRPYVERLILSHGDLDHAGGANALAQALPVEERVGAGGTRACWAGEAWAWDGVRFSFVYPRPGDLSADSPSNARSCVLRINGAGGATLLTGDIEDRTEALLVARDMPSLAADVLIVPHHGSASSSSQAFLDAVTPDYALISAGWNNRWGFPAATVVQRLSAVGAQIRNTATAGAIEVRVSPGSPIEVESWRAISARAWRVP
ncbi:competence protein ComEC [Salinisphaera dokdonensis CL-ES53]|uniref:Competence protein ComEC n=1 Tax=Salinisphaera dokdonensis CL-ES53 TaxID=1304272 RepID=A0ABV2B2G0_9GAMM